MVIAARSACRRRFPRNAWDRCGGSQSPQAQAPYSRRRRWRVPEARAAVDALAASGLWMSAFAEQEGLDEQRLYRWQRRFARERKAEPRTVTPSATLAIVELCAATSPSPRRGATRLRRRRSCWCQASSCALPRRLIPADWRVWSQRSSADAELAAERSRVRRDATERSTARCSLPDRRPPAESREFPRAS